MDRNFLVQLTNNVYRLTLLFPKKEPLRYKMREVAANILTKPNEKDLEVLNNFFEVALVQNWVSPSDILAIKKEYDKLRGEFGIFKTEKNKENPMYGGSTSIHMEVEPQSMLERQEKILTYLKENGRVQVWQMKQLFPDISKRTLRRDFGQMLKQGIIERIGERNDTFYQIRRIES